MPRRLDERVVARHAGALDEDVGAVEERDVAVVPELPPGANHLDAVALESAAAASPERASPRTTARLIVRARGRALRSVAVPERPLDRRVGERQHDGIADQVRDPRVARLRSSSSSRAAEGSTTITSSSPASVSASREQRPVEDQQAGHPRKKRK